MRSLEGEDEQSEIRISIQAQMNCHARWRRWKEKGTPKLWVLKQMRGCRNEREWGRGSYFSWVGCGPHLIQYLKWLKHHLAGPGRYRRKRKKWSLKNIVSKKYIFDMVLKIWNLGSDLMWKDCFAPWAEKLIVWVSNGVGLNTKVVRANLSYQKKSKL